MNINDIHQAVARARSLRFKNSEQWSLGQLIEEIEKCGTKDGDNDKTVCFDFANAVPDTLDSWRGSYDELALGFVLTGYGANTGNDYEHYTAQKLLDELKEAVGKEYTGWKGGEYIMHENTPLWVATPGNSGNTGICGVLDKEYEIVLITCYCEY